VSEGERRVSEGGMSRGAQLGGLSAGRTIRLTRLRPAMDLNVWGHHHGLSMGSHHAVDNLTGANPGTENVTYGFLRVLLSIPSQPRPYSVLA
jgi:hypothetical protein